MWWKVLGPVHRYYAHWLCLLYFARSTPKKQTKTYKELFQVNSLYSDYQICRPWSTYSRWQINYDSHTFLVITHHVLMFIVIRRRSLNNHRRHIECLPEWHPVPGVWQCLRDYQAYLHKLSVVLFYWFYLSQAENGFLGATSTSGTQ